MEAVFNVDRVRAVGELVEIDDLRAHAAAGARVYADKQLVVSRTSAPIGIKFTGEIDASNAHSVSSSIAVAMVPDHDLHIDVSPLLFCDISGIRAFVSAAEGLTAGQLLLHGMPRQLETVIRAVGWDRLPTLAVCECGMNPQ